MTQQEIFDHVVTSLITQGEPSMNITGVCFYRFVKGEKVLKCAAGWCIPDDKYDSCMEGKTVSHSRIRELHLFDKCEYMVLRLQRAHDGAAGDALAGLDFTESFKQRAKRIAEELLLDPKVAL